MIEAPDGFASTPLSGGGVLILDRSLSTTPLAAALQEPWRHVSPRPLGIGTGRGPRGVVTIAGAPVVLVKQCLRGGWLARFNRQRYFRLDRFAHELAASRAAHDAGLLVGETLAVTLVPARPGCFVWSTSRWVADAEDLAQLWLRTADQATRSQLWAAAIALLRTIADAGLEHPDLNLGNLLMRRDERHGWSATLIDFDRARWTGRPATAAARANALSRLERSRTKLERLAAQSEKSSAVL